VDVVGIMQQGGYQILPPAPLPHGINYLPPRAMDGIPSPDSNFAKPEDAEKARKAFRIMLEEDFVKQSTAARWWADDLMWCGPAGIGDAKKPEEYVQHFLVPLHAAFPKPKLRIGSMDCEGNYCGALFYLEGTNTASWLGQAATGRHVELKFGMHARFDLGLAVTGCGDCGQIVDAWVQIDIVGAFAHMGVDLLRRAKLQYMQAEESAAVASLGQEQMLAGLPPSEDVSGQGGVPTTQDLSGAQFVALVYPLGVVVVCAGFWRFPFAWRRRVVQEPLL